MFKALLVALCLLATPAFAGPLHTIGPDEDPGGQVFQYIAKYINWYNEQSDVRVEGECDSACTLVLGIIPLAHICATPNAEFGFHSAKFLGAGYAKAITEVMWEVYPDRVIRLLTPLGLGKAKDHPEIVYIDAQKVVHPCGAEPTPPIEFVPMQVNPEEKPK